MMTQEMLDTKVQQMKQRKADAKRAKSNHYRRCLYKRKVEAAKAQAWAETQERWRVAREEKAKRKAEREAKRAAETAEGERKRLEREAAKIPKKMREYMRAFAEGQAHIISQLRSIAPYCASCQIKLAPLLRQGTQQ